MEAFRVSAYYKAPHGLSVVHMVAACPTGESFDFPGILKCC